MMTSLARSILKFLRHVLSCSWLTASPEIDSFTRSRKECTISWFAMSLKHDFWVCVYTLGTLGGRHSEQPQTHNPLNPLIFFVLCNCMFSLGSGEVLLVIRILVIHLLFDFFVFSPKNMQISNWNKFVRKRQIIWV